MDFYGFTLLLRWILGWFIQPKLRSLPSQSANAEIVVIIPARNEEKAIAQLLNALKQSEIAPTELVVVDDHSTDKTAEIAQSLGAKVIKSKDLPL